MCQISKFGKIHQKCFQKIFGELKKTKNINIQAKCTRYLTRKQFQYSDVLFPPQLT